MKHRETKESKRMERASVQFSGSVVSDSLRPHEPEHARPPCRSPTPGVNPNSWTRLSDWTELGYLGHEDLFCTTSVYSCHLFLISSASVRFIPFLSFIEPICAWNIPLVSLIFLKRSLVFSHYVVSSICIDRWGRLSYLSLLFFGTLHSNGCIFPFLLCFLLLFFTHTWMV